MSTHNLKRLVMVELKQELDLLEVRLRRNLPASIASPQSQELAGAFQGDLNKYFDNLASFDITNLTTLNTVLGTFSNELQLVIAGYLAKAYIQGSIEMIQWGKTKTTGRPIFFEGPPMQQAIEWANTNGAAMVTRINDETKAQLSQIISDGIANKRGVDGIARDIRAAIADMSTTRSKLIAQTETGNALGQSVIDRSLDMGVNGKEWILGSGGKAGNCQLCKKNANAGVIPIDQEFPSGVMTTLQHPGCTCAVVPAMIK